jgi:hypothetical protein
MENRFPGAQGDRKTQPKNNGPHENDLLLVAHVARNIMESKDGADELADFELIKFKEQDSNDFINP